MKLIVDNTEEIDSYLGTNPTCDICKESIKVGDEVIQTFIGIVRRDQHAEEFDYPIQTFAELGIVTRTYRLVHPACVLRKSE
jgi:hypothetical protein